jgi:hypothetical protein
MKKSIKKFEGKEVKNVNAVKGGHDSFIGSDSTRSGAQSCAEKRGCFSV